MKAIKMIVIIIGIVVAIIIVAVVGLILLSGYKNENYWKFSEPRGEIETKYTAFGSYEVSYAEFNADGKAWGKYEIWYPSEMKDGTTYPLVVMANGTGTKASQYKEVFRHLASWGFIVAGNEDENCRTGESSSATLDFVLGLNKDDDSIFYGKVDTEHIGIAGHSQGGVGAVNAVTEQENGEKYKAIYSISATSRYHADELNKNGLDWSSEGTVGTGWNVDAAKINIPLMMIAGTGDFDAGSMTEYAETLPEGKAQGICPLWWLNECYDTIPDGVDKVIARQTGKDHGDMLRSADGYMTAWFMYYLKGDSEAGKAFWGEDAEILSNENWQDVKVNP